MRVERLMNVAIGGATLALTLSILLRTHPQLATRLRYHLAVLHYNTWMLVQPKWKLEAFKVRGRIQ